MYRQFLFDMKSNPVGPNLSVQHSSRWSRLLGAFCAMAFMLTSAYAQLATATIGGVAGSTGSSNVGLGTFSTPSAVAVDANGNTYIADTSNNVIRKISSAGVVSTLVGTGVAGTTNDATAGAPTAQFSAPRGLTLNAAGTTIYVSDTGNNSIRVVALTAIGGTVTGVSTLVPTGTFVFPLGIVADASGNLYVADNGNNIIRKVVIAGAVVSRLAGSATGASGFVNGDADTSRFTTPFGVALNAAGDTLYVADYGNHAIRRITGLSGTVAVATHAGTGVAGFSDNATGTSATFRNPAGVAVNAAGNVYVADYSNNAIRLIAVAAGNAVTTPVGPAATNAGPGAQGSVDGTSTGALFRLPFGLATRTIGGTEYLYIADQGNNTIRRASTPVGPSVGNPTPATQAVNVGGTATITATVTGFPAPTLTWERNPGGTGVFAAIPNAAPYSGVNTNTLTITGATLAMNNDTFRLSATNSVAGPVVSSIPAILTVNQPPTFSSGSVTFNATVGQFSSFSVAAAGSGTITYSAPAGAFGLGFSLASNGTISGTPTSTSEAVTNVTVTATNTVGTGTQLVSITVAPASSNPVITTHPTDFVVPVGQTFANPAFSVNASTSNPAVSGYQWQIRQADLVTWTNLANDGIYSGVNTTALAINAISPASNGSVFRVVVTNASGSTNSNPATLIVSSLPVFTNVTSTTFITNQSNSFTFTATGGPAPSVSTGSALPAGVTLSTAGVLSGVPTITDGTPFNLVISATNSAGTATMNPFQLNVSVTAAAVAISLQPLPATVQLGATATFTSGATGSPAPSLRWQRQPSGTTGYIDLFDDGVYSGTATATLSVINVAAGMSGDIFRMVATNTVNGVPGSISSDPVALTVNIGTTITTFAGEPGVAGSTDATGLAARFSSPASIAVDTSGNFYVADAANHIIRKISPAGVVTTLAGVAGSSGNTDGVGSAARFNAPAAVTVDSIGNVFVADTYNHTIRAITPSGSVSTLAGLPNNSGSADGTGTAARFSFPSGIAVDLSVSIYVADSANHTIRRITSGGVVTTFAGSAGLPGSTNANGTVARFNYPNGLAIGQGGVVYVADSFNHLIRRITPSADVSTLAGGAGAAGSVDGNGTAARFNQPTGVGADTLGNVYVADTFSHTIRRISSVGDVTTLAGAVGVPGSTDGVGLSARFNQPFALTIDVNGNLYVADTRNNTIRRSGTTSAPVITTQPQSRTAVTGTTATFTVVATGTPTPSFQWQRQAAGTAGFVNLTNDAIHSGVTTAILSVANVFTTNSGDQYRVVLTNGISPSATSDAATLTIGEAPVFTTGTTATFKAGEPGTFTIAASGSPPSTFSVSGHPTWLTLSASSGVVVGTPPVGSEGEYVITFTANNGVATNQTFTLTVTPAVVAPTITGQPGPLAINQGQSATFNVVAAGTAPLSYQWRRDGNSISGATASSLTLSNVQPSNAATYSVRVTNAAGSVDSTGATLTVNTAPVFASQPQAQVALAGGTVTFNVAITGGAGATYQWRKNGVAIAGANSATLTLGSLSAADVANYDVVVTNSLGSITSSLAQLTLATSATAPVITSRPASRAVLVGGTTTLRVGASGVPTPTYQWRKNGAIISGATNSSLTLSNVTAADDGGYDVVVTNGSGGVTTSPAAQVRILARSYAGVYFGTFGGGAGNFALYVRDDNTGVFLGYLTGSVAPVMGLNVTVNDSGEFSFSQGAIASASSNPGEPDRAAALAPTLVNGTINAEGSVLGFLFGGSNAGMTGSRASAAGPTANVAGFYQAGSGTNSAVAYTIAGPNSQSFVVAQSGNTYDGGMGIVNSSGAVTVVTARGTTISETVTPSGIVTGAASGAINASLSGGSDTALALQRLVNISSRARVGAGDAAAIAGFVISGEESKLVLIRAVGPTLGAAPFNVGGVLASPRLEVFRGSTSLAVNAGIGTNRSAIDAAGVQAGAFPLGAAGSDAAILTTLAPGNYTAVVSSTVATGVGVALVEVYDLSSASPGQKLINIATRASAGAGDNLLIAGFVVPPGTSKRVLIRAVGPGLTPFGVTGVLAQPSLVVFNGAQATIAQNTNWRTSTDAEVITTASASVGAFGLATNDSAVVLTLAPGNYTAQVLGAGTTTGIALIEVYELP